MTLVRFDKLSQENAVARAANTEEVKGKENEVKRVEMSAENNIRCPIASSIPKQSAPIFCHAYLWSSQIIPVLHFFAPIR